MSDPFTVFLFPAAAAEQSRYRYRSPQPLL